MKRALIIFLVLLAILVTPFVPQIPDLVAVHMAKSGLVVDSKTGKPMPNVIVIAAGWSSSGPVFMGPGGYLHLYQIVTFTDADGRYEIPSTWSKFGLGVPGSEPRSGWFVTAFKPGYAVVGDEDSWRLFYDNGTSIHEPHSVKITPSSTSHGFYFEVEAIKLYQPTMSLKEAAVYYSAIMGAARLGPFPTDPNKVAIKQQGYDLLVPRVCAIDSSAELDYSTMYSIYGFSKDIIAASELLKELEPKQYRTEASDHPKFTAGNVCKIVTNGRGVP